jgi:ABC-type Fe3+/spermidine/putrescine transport system ATPase subunit
VTLPIRPESVRVVAAGPPSASRGIEGAVEEATYLGGARRYAIRLNPAERLVARVPTSPDASPLALGSPVRVDWDPPHLRLL